MPVMKRKRGFFCPVCQKRATNPYSRSYPINGMRVQYFKCVCGARFKVRARLEPPK